jgi:hypothetical protein
MVPAAGSHCASCATSRARVPTIALHDACVRQFVLESLFRSVSLVPVRRPHADDEVVANLARYESTRLSTAYLDDVAALRDAVVGGLYPAHKCRDNSSGSVPLFPKRCGQRPFTGAELVEQIGVWLKCARSPPAASVYVPCISYPPLAPLRQVRSHHRSERERRGTQRSAAPEGATRIFCVCVHSTIC